MGGDRLLQAVLHRRTNRRVALLLRLHDECGVIELVVKRAERRVGQVDTVASDHRLRLGQPGLGEIKVVGQLVRRAEGQRAADVFQHPLERVKDRIREAVSGGRDGPGDQQHGRGHCGQHQAPHRVRARSDRGRLLHGGEHQIPAPDLGAG